MIALLMCDWFERQIQGKMELLAMIDALASLNAK